MPKEVIEIFFVVYFLSSLNVSKSPSKVPIQIPDSETTFLLLNADSISSTYY